MPATDVKFGISRHSGALIEMVETERKREKKVLKGSTGNSARIHSYDPTTDFSVKGHGTNTVVPGIGSNNITDLNTGVSHIDSVKDTENNEDFDGWEYKGVNYPNATEVV